MQAAASCFSLPLFMEHTEHHIDCPVCGSSQIAPVLKAKDYTVSGEIFEIWQCEDCKLRFTQDIPEQHSIGKYYQSTDYISHSETKKGLVNSLYHLVRKRTLHSKRRLIEKLTGQKSGQLLDIGCGTGSFIYEMKQHGWNVCGLEPDAGARKKAETVYGLSTEPIEVFFNLPEKNFDVITLWHVLEHVHELHDYLQQLRRLLKSGGILIIAVPNYTSKDATHYKAHWAAYDVPRHLYHFSPESMERLTRQHNFKLTAIQPMWFDSFYVSMLSEKYKNGKGNLPAAFLTGGFSNLNALQKRKQCSSLIYILS